MSPPSPPTETFANRYAQTRATHPPGHIERVAAAEGMALNGGNAGAWLTLGFEHFAAFRFAHGHSALSEALKRNPQLLAAHWLRFQFPDAVAPQDDAQAERFRQRWIAGVTAFEQLDSAHPDVRAQIWGCVGSATAFYRHYLGDCIAEQHRYGNLVHRMMAALDPGSPSRPLRVNKRRILFISPYLFQHTVARLFVPLIEGLDRDRFDIHLLHLGGEDDAMTVRARAVGTFHGGPREGPDWRSLISGLSADVIVYLDIGMHPLTQGLAALRLAPVQCVLWGHPVTTGLPSIDWFLSADDLEPGDAETHYSERLLRLPGLGHGLELSEAIEGPPRSDHRQGSDLICAQSAYKLMPAQDALFARVLAELPQSRLHMIPHQDPSVREWLRERMRPALDAAGVDADQRIVMHGYRSLDEFLLLADRAAVNLDSLGWSGGMTGLDLLSRGLPTVTLPGDTMRSRQTAALLERLGVTELIASDTDSWVSIAVALIRDPDWNAEISDRLASGVARLNDRTRVVSALTDFLASCTPLSVT
jgi:protein O-GlcNAc transferase